MRIGLLALHFAEYASRLALALSVRHEVVVVLNSRNARDELSEDLRASLDRAVTVRRLDLPRLRDPRMLGTLLSIDRILLEFSPDILHVQEFHPAYTGWARLSFRGHIPVVLEVHDHVHHSGTGFHGGWRWRVTQWFRRQATRLIVHGPRMQAELETMDARVAGRIDVVPHGILGRATVDGDVSGCDQGTFLFFGRIESYKGLRYLLDACDVLFGRGRRDFRVVVAGRGGDLECHRARIAANARVELMDRYVPAAEVPDLFRRAMAVVLPYTDATQSGVAAMAFAHSRPVIATRVGDVPEVVIDGQTGLMVPPRNANALADAMGRLLTDRRLRDSLAAGAARFAKERLSWPRIADQMDDVYRRALMSR